VNVVTRLYSTLCRVLTLYSNKNKLETFHREAKPETVILYCGVIIIPWTYLWYVNKHEYEALLVAEL
jgi:hypothetical protein